MSNRFLGGLYLLVIWRWQRRSTGVGTAFVSDKWLRIKE
jgi:hypothetical protein